MGWRKNSNRRAADTTAKCKDPLSGVKSVEGWVPVFRDWATPTRTRRVEGQFGACSSFLGWGLQFA